MKRAEQHARSHIAAMSYCLTQAVFEPGAIDDVVEQCGYGKSGLGRVLPQVVTGT